MAKRLYFTRPEYAVRFNMENVITNFRKNLSAGDLTLGVEGCMNTYEGFTRRMAQDFVAVPSVDLTEPDVAPRFIESVEE